MSDKFKGKMIFSDVDGTLISSKTGDIPKENIEAIKYFVENGGIFTLATGRGHRSAANFMEQLPINAPCVFLNGGQIYDAQKREILEKSFLPKHSKELLGSMMERFTDTTAIVICEDDGYYLATEDKTGDKYSEKGKEKLPRLDIHTTEKVLCKVLFIIGDKDYEEFIAFTKTLHIEGIKVVFSGERCAEVIPDECTKANGMLNVANMHDIDPADIIAIGDYFNDYEMIQKAGLGVSVKNGHPEIKAIADAIMCHCDEGALSDLISYIEDNII